MAPVHWQLQGCLGGVWQNVGLIAVNDIAEFILLTSVRLHTLLL